MNSNQILIVLQLIACCGIPASTSAQCWIYKYSGTSSWLNGVSFSDQNHGFIVGDDGIVRQTTNGGASWQGHNFKIASPFYAVDCVDSTTVTIVGYSPDDAAGTIYHTTNGGTSWSRQNSTTPEVLYGVDFLNRDTGFAVGSGGTILLTTNGGASWRPRDSGTLIDLRGVSFLTKRVAIAVGGYGVILRTTNTGLTWTTVQNGLGALNAVTFVDSSVGYIVGTNGTILKSTNSGLDWVNLSINSEYFFYAVSFIDANRGTAVGYNQGNGIVAHTTDGGVLWQRIPIPNNALFGVAVHDATIGTAVSWNGGILREFDDCSQAGWFAPELPSDGSLYEPLSTSFSVVRSLTLQWNLLPDINVKGTVVQLATDSTFASAVVVNTLVTLKASLITRKLTVPNLLPGTTYFWRLKINYEDGSSTAWTPVWRFTTATGSISGEVFEDANRDSIWNPEERSLAGWQVDLIGNVKNSLLTDSLGRFRFEGMGSGSYTVAAGLPLVWTCTVPPDTVYHISLNGGDSVSGLRFGNYFPWNTVSGTVFNDLNENGLQDVGEPGLAQWRVRVEGNANDSVVTDGNGNFSFPHLTLGTMIFTPAVQQSWEQINPQLGAGHTLILNSFDQHYTGKDFSIHRIPPRVKMGLFVKDSTSFAHRSIWWGARPGATRSIWGADTIATTADFSEGEFDLPPQVPGLFDARFENPSVNENQFGYGSWTDMRSYTSPTQADTYYVTFSPAYIYGGDYPMTFQWSKAAIESSYAGPVQMRDYLGNTADMKLSDYFLVIDPTVTAVTIIAQRPRLPVVAVEESPQELPGKFALMQNFPNPFNPSTVIRYQIPEGGTQHAVPVRLVIYNVLGEVVAVLVDEMQDVGYKSVEWDAKNVPSGVYFCRLTAGTFTGVRKMLVMR